MTETLTDPISATRETAPDIMGVVAPSDASTQPVTSQAPQRRKKDRFATVTPVLEKLFELYPHLFGQHFLPLKLGIFQELLAAHPTEFKRDMLKVALGVHTRSTRYLQCVAAGNKRHDLAGQAVDEVAPEHVFLSIVELHQRRQARTAEDLLPRLQRQLVAAYSASGLTRGDYLSRLPTLEDSVAAVLDEAMMEVDLQRARHAALVKAYQGSGKSVDDFAADLGMPAGQLRAALKQARAA